MFKRGDIIEIIKNGKKAEIISVNEKIICVKLKEFPGGFTWLFHKEIKIVNNV